MKKIIFSLAYLMALQQPLHAGIFDSFIDGIGKGAGKEIGKTITQTAMGENKDRIILALLIIGGLLIVRYIYLSEQRSIRTQARNKLISNKSSPQFSF